MKAVTNVAAIEACLPVVLTAFGAGYSRDLWAVRLEHPPVAPVAELTAAADERQDARHDRRHDYLLLKTGSVE
jgi:hypothetical protein